MALVIVARRMRNEMASVTAYSLPVHITQARYGMGFLWGPARPAYHSSFFPCEGVAYSQAQP